MLLARISHKACSRRGQEADGPQIERGPPHYFGGYSVLPITLIGEKCGLVFMLFLLFCFPFLFCTFIGPYVKSGAMRSSVAIEVELDLNIRAGVYAGTAGP